MPRSSAPPARSLVSRLDAEWAALRHDRDAVRRAAGWEVVSTDLRHLDQVLEAIGFGQGRGRPSSDAHLRHLVELGRDDALAARVVLQRLLPGLLAVVRRRSGSGTSSGSPSWSAGPAEQIDELIGEAWIAIVTFNPRRRPGCLAAALIADADDRAFRQRWRKASATEVVTTAGFDQIAAVTVVHASHELASVIADAAASGMHPDDLDLLHRLATADSTDDVARSLAVTARTVRNRRTKLTGRLRDLALAA